MYKQAKMGRIHNPNPIPSKRKKNVFSDPPGMPSGNVLWGVRGSSCHLNIIHQILKISPIRALTTSLTSSCWGGGCRHNYSFGSATKQNELNHHHHPRDPRCPTALGTVAANSSISRHQLELRVPTNAVALREMSRFANDQASSATGSRGAPTVRRPHPTTPTPERGFRPTRLVWHPFTRRNGDRKLDLKNAAVRKVLCRFLTIWNDFFWRHVLHQDCKFL